MQDIRKTQSKAQKNPTGGHYDYGRQGTSTTYILQKILTNLKKVIMFLQHQQVLVQFF